MKYKLLFFLLWPGFAISAQEKDYSDIEEYKKKVFPSKFVEEFKTEKDKKKFSRLREFLDERQDLYESLRNATKFYPDKTAQIPVYQKFIAYIAEVTKDKKDDQKVSIDLSRIYDNPLSSIAGAPIGTGMVQEEVRVLKKLSDRYEQEISTLKDNAAILQKLNENSSVVKNDIVQCKRQMDDLDLDVKEQDFRASTSKTFSVLIGGLLIVFFFIVYMKSDNNLTKELLSGYGLQFITLFVLIIAVILFGILGILQSSELAAILSGISGYILGKGVPKDSPVTTVLTPTPVTPTAPTPATNIKP